MKRWLFRLGVVLVLFAAGVTIWGYKNYESVISRRPLDAYVKEIREQDTYVTLESVSPMFLKAMVGIEDQRFYTRATVIDLRSLGRAFVTNVTSLSLAEGGSTLTQQTAKNMYFTNDTSFVRKVSEYFVGRDLISNYSKDEIFELYINLIYFGNNAYGIEEASLKYFGVQPNALTDAQATMLAGLPKAPTSYNPMVSFDRAKQRQEVVLDKLVDLGYINEVQRREIYETEVFNDE